MANPGNISSSNQDDDCTIGSTPSGIATPQPDLSDKRLPGIMHSFFAQVRAGSDSTSNISTNMQSPSIPSSVVPEESCQPSGEKRGWSEKHTSLSADPTVTMKHDRFSESVSCSCSGRHCDNNDTDVAGTEKQLVPAGINPLPTPPRSSFCSITQKDLEEAENGAAAVETGVGAVYRALKNMILSKTSFKSNTRHSSYPVSSHSCDPMLAPHISNPCLPSSPTFQSSPTSLVSPPVSKSSVELVKLTDSAVVGPRTKNTPPLTPRAMSNETQTLDKKSIHSPTSSPIHGQLRQTKSKDQKTQTPPEPSFSRSSTSSETQGPPVASLKGKLTVKIVEGRGLRPSADPYVVCVFEWNQYISNGVKSSDPNCLDPRNSRLEALSSAPIQRSNSDSGRPMAIPMKSRQSSHNSTLDGHNHNNGSTSVTDPLWNHDATFDVLGSESEIDVSVYDHSNHEAFLGHVRLSLNMKDDHKSVAGWFPLSARAHSDGPVIGEIYLQMNFQKTDRKQVGPNDFKILKLIGRGTFGQVYQVQKKDTLRIYAMKVLSKKVIIQKKEVAHTLGERNILVRTATTDSPFIVGLKFSFQTPTDLYLVTDYMSGGELFWHLQKEGRFQEPRAKFYIAELILALQHLHEHDIVYRDLKPENILLDANGHIALCDFGLSKANLTKNDTTTTFCGTTEYLAPEVLLDEQGYTKMVDFWSLGVLVFEMCCGWSPFYAEDTQQMYKNIAFGKVRFPRDALSAEGRNFVKGLLNRNPRHRLGAKEDARELMAHPFFHDVDWRALALKNVPPPFKPKLKSVMDTSYFDPEFTTALENSSALNDRAAALVGNAVPASTPLSPGMQANFKGFTFVNESSMDHHMGDRGDANHFDSMDEDDDWVQQSRLDVGDHRMSGVARTSESESGIFNDDYNFDM
ncbi:hypothetical protein FQN57_000028 [Myotisia sp. PD_48]|nr:hypothetical protein FQN57_000028 [Myotisia sp. PD_48]